MRAPAASALCVSLALAACLGGPMPVSVAPHLDWAIAADRASSGRPGLGLGAIADLRPDAMRSGSRPALELGLGGVVREGIERTGDDAFDAPVLDAVRGDLLATLLRSGTFANVESVGFDPRDPAAWPAPSAPDFVLIGELEELSGSQWHSFVVTPFRVGFVRDRWGTPLGRMALRFELWSREGLVLRDRVATRTESSRGGLADAALEALALGGEALAARLDAELRDASRTPRLLDLRLLDACALGADGARRLIAQTTEVFTREADVALVARPESWTPPASARDLDALLEAASRVAAPPGGVVLALAPAGSLRELSIGARRTGLAIPLGTHAVALCPAEGEASVLTAAHELAHLFGAVHVRESASIMNDTAEFDARFFDPLNRRILRELRERDFARPLDAATSARLAAIYRAAERFPERVDPAALDSALRALEE
ncbi:MAG: hypothetical protein FJ108_07705 [Deltaproteobacteria bacterium]|nr:hypothetical protein [Deltaproteobacteria bacterium]